MPWMTHNEILTPVRHNHGIASVEFALTLPIQLAILVGVLEFGSYMLEAQVTNRSIASLSYAISDDPTNPDLLEMARTQGLAVAETDVALNTSYACAQSYDTLESAKAGKCDGTQWSTMNPTDEGGRYYVALGVRSEQRSLTGLFDGLIPDIDHREIIPISPKAASDEEEGENTRALVDYRLVTETVENRPGLEYGVRCPSGTKVLSGSCLIPAGTPNGPYFLQNTSISLDGTQFQCMFNDKNGTQHPIPIQTQVVCAKVE